MFKDKAQILNVSTTQHVEPAKVCEAVLGALPKVAEHNGKIQGSALVQDMRTRARRLRATVLATSAAAGT